MRISEGPDLEPDFDDQGYVVEGDDGEVGYCDEVEYGNLHLFPAAGGWAERPDRKDPESKLIYQAQAGSTFAERFGQKIGASILYGGTVHIGDNVEFWEHLWREVTRQKMPPPHQRLVALVDDDTSEF